MKKIFFLFFIALAVLLEGTVISVPIILDMLLVFYIFKKTPKTLILAFVFGIVLDVFAVKPLGSTSIFFLLFIFLVFLYERKFETATYFFVFFSSFLGSIMYLMVLGYNNAIFQAIVSSMLAVLVFRFFVILSKAKDLDSSSLYSSE